MGFISLRIKLNLLFKASFEFKISHQPSAFNNTRPEMQSQWLGKTRGKKKKKKKNTGGVFQSTILGLLLFSLIFFIFQMSRSAASKMYAGGIKITSAASGLNDAGVERREAGRFMVNDVGLKIRDLEIRGRERLRV